MDINENQKRVLETSRAKLGLTTLATVGSILTLVDQVSIGLSKDEATTLNGSMSREALQSVALKRIEERLNIQRG